MIVLPQGNPSIRERIMAVLIQRFKDQVAGVNGARITWDVVKDVPLSKADQEQGYALGIYDTSERVKNEIQRDERFLNVVFEGHIRLAEDDDGPKIVRAVMGDVQRVAQIDLNTKEPDGYHLTVNVSEKGNEIDISAPGSMQVAFAVICEYHYRTKANDPTRRG